MPTVPACNDAEFSSDQLERRLWLSRRVADEGPVGLIIGLNPSKAGAAIEDTDHTITKEMEFARRWGWSGFWKANLFTCIETYSANLKNLSYHAAVGPWGSHVLEELIPLAPEIVVCWGSALSKDKRHRITSVCEMIRVLKNPRAPVHCFGLSKQGNPVHPLMLSYNTPLVPYPLASVAERPSRRDDE